MACLWHDSITSLDIDDDYICGVCHAPFNNPVVWPCGHTFCKTCTDQAFNVTNKCPECKQESTQLPTTRNIVMARAIDNKLECHCLARPDCQWIGKVGMFNNHISACDAIITICDNVGCDFQDKRASVRLHQSACVYDTQTSASCPLCNKVMPRCEITGHMMGCQQRVILCPVRDCGNPVMIQELEGHLDTPGHGRRIFQQLMCSLFDRTSRMIEPDVRVTSATRLVWTNSCDSSMSPVVEVQGIQLNFTRKDSTITMTIKSCSTTAFWFVWVGNAADYNSAPTPIKIIEGETYTIGTINTDVVNIHIRPIILV